MISLNKLHISTAIISLYFLQLIFSCQSPEERKNQQLIKDWMGKEIFFPQTLQRKNLAEEKEEDLLKKQYKILLYVDSSECTQCRLQLYEWQRKIEETRKYSDSLAFILVVNTRNIKLIEILAQKNKFHYPIYFDKNGKMNAINHFPKEPLFQTFLLDSSNKILLIGNPIKNKQLWNLYENIISGKNDKS